MEYKTTTLMTTFYTLNFKFSVLCEDTILTLKYSYNNTEYNYRGRTRKIYNDRKGKYFMFERYKVRFE